MKSTLYALMFIAALFVIAAFTACSTNSHFDRMQKSHRCLVQHAPKHVKTKAINNCAIWTSKTK